MRTQYLLVALFVLFVWASRDKLSPQFQFWKKYATNITVQNHSDKDLSGVTVVVWSTPHHLGTITKGQTKTLDVLRLRDITDVIIKFMYGSEALERLVGTLDEDTDYTMNIRVHFAGVVTAQVGTASAAGSGDKSR
jgi:hypothetical protein